MSKRGILHQLLNIRCNIIPKIRVCIEQLGLSKPGKRKRWHYEFYTTPKYFKFPTMLHNIYYIYYYIYYKILSDSTNRMSSTTIFHGFLKNVTSQFLLPKSRI